MEKGFIILLTPKVNLTVLSLAEPCFLSITNENGYQPQFWTRKVKITKYRYVLIKMFSLVKENKLSCNSVKL